MRMMMRCVRHARLPRGYSRSARMDMDQSCGSVGDPQSYWAHTQDYWAPEGFRRSNPISQWPIVRYSLYEAARRFGLPYSWLYYHCARGHFGYRSIGYQIAAAEIPTIKRIYAKRKARL